MAGAGQRFVDAGYKTHKPAIPTIDRFSGKLKPMVVCATQDLPGVAEGGKNLIYVDRDFHREDGIEAEILKYYPLARFITTETLTEGQACTCLLAEDLINNYEELLIAGCDNGMVFDAERFQAAKNESDVLVFTYRHNESVLINPNAYGWVVTNDDSSIRDLSIKRAVSSTPMNDHAIVATFWFRRGRDFVRSAQKMIAENDRINGEFYVDEVIRHALALGLKCKVFEIKRYIGWGTPKDYEQYMDTLKYWSNFVSCCSFFKSKK